MAKKASVSLSEFFFKHRMVFLLVAILSMIIGSPFVDELFHYGITPDILLTIVFIAAIYAIGHKTHHLVISVLLALPMLVSVWTSFLYRNIHLFIIGEIFAALFIGFTILRMIQFIFNEKEVSKEVIYAAVIVYLLMAMMWSFAYALLEYVYPDSFSYPGGPGEDTFRFLYFSFVTITTLGYGDITPLTRKASSLVMLEAVTGQMYLVVVVAWLVGMHVSRRSK